VSTKPNQKLQLSVVSSYTFFQTQSGSDDPSVFIHLAPNGPNQWESKGRLVWEDNGVGFGNPLSLLRNIYQSNMQAVTAHAAVYYPFSPHFSVRSDAGFYRLRNRETSTTRIDAQNPAINPSGAYTSATNQYTDKSATVQTEYAGGINRWGFSGVLGATLEQQDNQRSYEEATGYTNDSLLGKTGTGEYRSAGSFSSRYLYEALYAATDVHFEQTVFANLSGRRNGSSQFGPKNRFGNFYAIGLGWIFTRNKFMRSRLPFLRFGKIKGSFGTTGNDQLGNFQNLETWRTNSRYSSYGSLTGLNVDYLNDSTFTWEVTKKLTVATELDMGWITLSVTWFRHRSSNQVVSYNIPSQSGISLVSNKNIPATVQNTGWELEFIKNAIHRGKFYWTFRFNVTFPHNILLAFPGLATSAYANSLQVGESLTMQRGLHFIGVNSQTGLYEVAGKTKNGSFVPDTFVNGNLDPKAYGALSTAFTLHHLQLGLVFKFRCQSGIDPLSYFYRFMPPGKVNDLFLTNQTTAVLNRWRKPGDNAPIQRFSMLPNSAASASIPYYSNSDRVLVNASYLQLSNIALSYLTNIKWAKAQCKWYVQAHNVFTWTGFQGADVFTQNPAVLPTLITAECGFQLTR
jgi:hypothetical protein